MQLRGGTSPLARPAEDRGQVAPGLPLQDMLLLLRRSPAQEAALQQLLDQQREKGSPHYHRWLTPAEFGAEFGPAPEDIQKITGWLAQEGFTVNRVAVGRDVIEFSGTELEVEAALHTAIHRYQVRGAMHLANASNPSIPAALAPVVAGVVSLNNFRARPSGRIVGEGHVAAIVPGEARPSLTYTGKDGQIGHAIAPADLATIYDVKPLAGASLDGTGQVIAVVARSDVAGGDILGFQGLFLGGNSPPLDTVQVGADPGITSNGDADEATLDVEWAQALAPRAQVDLVVSAGSNTTDGIDLAAEYAVDHDLAPVMTTSFGACEAQLGGAENQFWSSLWEQAAAEGITALVSAGDSGAAACDDPNSETVAQLGQAVNGIASTPFDTAVGGTELNDAGGSGYWASTSAQTNAFGTALGYIPEAAWNESAPATTEQPAIWAGGGGASTIYAKPLWQSGPGVPDDGRRDVPDISLAAASHDGYVVCLAGACDPTERGFSFYVFGGTSASSPSTAGLMALLDEQQGGPQGLVNRVLYRLAQDAGANGFHDVTAGSNLVPCTIGSPNCTTGTLGFPATPGFDLATGLGSPDGANLLRHWSDISFAATTTTLTITPPAGWSYGEPAPIAVQVDGQGSDSDGAEPGGAVMLFAQQRFSSSVQTFPLDAGVANGSLNRLPAGTSTLTARYFGDSRYGASSSAPQTVTVAPTATVTRIGIFNSANLQPITSMTYGDPVTIQAQVTPAAGTGVPTGTVQMNNFLGYITLGSNGAGSNDTEIFQQSGTLSLQGTYSGDENFQSSQSTPITINISKAPTSVVLTEGPYQQTPTVTLDMFNLSVSTNVVSGFSPTGTVNFYEGDTLVHSTQASGYGPHVGQKVSATAVWSPQSLPGTSVTLRAVYEGDGNYLPASSNTITVPTSANFTGQPASLDFRSLAVDTRSAAQTMTLTNAGGSAGTAVLQLNSSEYILSGSCLQSVAPGASCALNIAFNPSQVGDRGVVLTLAGGGQTELHGIGAGFQAPASVAFQTTAAGQSAVFPVVFTPVGAFTGPVALSCSNLPPLASCSFSPSAPVFDGVDPLTVEVSILTTSPAPASGSGSEAAVLLWLGLAGTGMGGGVLATAAGRRVRRRRSPSVGLGLLIVTFVACGGGGGGVPIMNQAPPSGGSPTQPSQQLPPTVSPAAIDFGSVGLGATATAKVQLSNSGPNPIAAQAVQPYVSGADLRAFSVSNGCTGAMAAGASCAVQISFSPTWIGQQTGTLIIPTGIPGTPDVPLQGTGIYTRTPPGTYYVTLTASSGGVSTGTTLPFTVH